MEQTQYIGEYNGPTRTYVKRVALRVGEKYGGEYHPDVIAPIHYGTFGEAAAAKQLREHIAEVGSIAKIPTDKADLHEIIEIILWATLKLLSRKFTSLWIISLRTIDRKDSSYA